MLIYGYKGKKCLVSTNENNHTNLWALYHYFGEVYNGYPTSMIAKHVYYSYSTLCKFNNSLVNTYKVTDNYLASIYFVKNYLEQNTDIENSVDSKCRSIYDHLRIWYKRLANNPHSLDDIKWEVAKTMKYYEKQEIFRVASINLKRNYYDFVV